MKCPTCGNEITPGEAFCGQCGTPSTGSLPGYSSADRMNMPSPHSGLLSPGSYAASTAFVPPPHLYQPGAFPPSQSQGVNIPFDISPAPDSAPLNPANPHQQAGFYHDATEAMAPVQLSNSGLLPGYQQPFSDIVAPTNYPGGQVPPPGTGALYPFQTGNYAVPQPTHYPFGTGQGYTYGAQGNFPHPSQKQSNHIILIVCVTLVIILLGAVGITTFALLNRSNTNQTATALAPKIVATPVPTSIPTPVPTPSPIPTPAADAGFVWCGTSCNQFGFTTEFPAGWQGMPANNSQGIQFVNPATQNVYAAFKTAGATTDASNTVLMNDVQSTFGSQPGYIAPTPPPAANATIGGAPWYAIATDYNDNQNQPIHVEVYATVYQGKAYIIELQSPQSNGQFDSAKQQFFVNMLVKFQFVPVAQ